jgi:glycosyltransferase involved in cell wall biosynthesis
MVIAPTRAMLAALEREHGAVCASRVVRNARDPERFPPLAKEPFVLAAGRLWDEAKNVAALERVAPALPWPVRIAGETTMPGREPAAAARARHVGVLSESELARCMGHASIYALPARYEPFGLSALEAALAGCALVLGDLASLRELWDGAARFVAPNDDAALRAALSTLIADANERERVARRCRARALGYAPARMARGYLDAYGAVRASAHAEEGEGEGEGFACAS